MELGHALTCEEPCSGNRVARAWLGDLAGAVAARMKPPSRFTGVACRPVFVRSCEQELLPLLGSEKETT